MFAALTKYKKRSFFKDHRYIYFETLEGTHVYEVIFALLWYDSLVVFGSYAVSTKDASWQALLASSLLCFQNLILEAPCHFPSLLSRSHSSFLRADRTVSDRKPYQSLLLIVLSKKVGVSGLCFAIDRLAFGRRTHRINDSVTAVDQRFNIPLHITDAEEAEGPSCQHAEKSPQPKKLNRQRL